MLETRHEQCFAREAVAEGALAPTIPRPCLAAGPRRLLRRVADDPSPDLVAGVAELQRPPFDIPVADAELVFGPYTEYGGLRFALFILAYFGSMGDANFRSIVAKPDNVPIVIEP